MLPPQFHKVGVVTLLKKYIFTVVSPIQDVVEGSISDRWNIGWRDLFYPPGSRPDRSHGEASQS